MFNSGFRPAVNAGLSVSRVGGAAQIKAMKKISGSIRIELAQYRELAAFSQFSSDLDPETKAQLAQGERIREILKQDQYKPMPVENEVIIIYAATKKYLIDIEKMTKQTEEEVTLAYYLPKVVEEAVKLHMPGIFIGDVIQEGNVSLMLYLGENKKATEAEVLEQVRAGIRVMLESHTEEKRRDKKMVERVNDLDETIKSMKEEYGRKVSVDEVAERMGITEDTVEDILKLAGEEVKDE